MKISNRDIFQITEVNRTVLKRSCTKETLDIQNCSLDSPDDDAMELPALTYPALAAGL